MLTNQEAIRLIGLPKKVIEKGNPVDVISWRWENGKARYFLSVEQEPNYSFLLDIQQSLKNNLKITLHFQEDKSKIGLLRIDYHGQHQNPREIKSSLPDRFKPYAAKWFDYHEHHIHYYVEGYKPLAWAIPLADDEFPVKDITTTTNIFPVIQEFAVRINLETKFERVSS